MQGNIAKKGRGNADSVRAIPGLWLDIDISNPAHKQNDLPKNIEEAMSLFDDTPFKPTITVWSGHGLHLWFLFDKPFYFAAAEDHNIASQLSRKLQATFQYAAREKGWKLDNTSDLARLLRLPGTVNRKREPVDVHILEEFTDYSRRYTIRALEDFVAEHESKVAPTKPIKPVPVPQDTAGDDPFVPDLDRVLDGCGFLRHCRDDAATLSEPEWYAALSVVGRCQDGHRHAHDWSRSYPGYSYEETARKLEHALASTGPRTCADIIEKYAPEACAGCPHRGKIKSPIVLGIAIQPLPLKSAVASPRPFPVECLGPTLGPAVKVVSDATGAPLALAGQSFLAAATLAVQGHADVEIDGRRFPTSNYFFTVAASGERKSATDKEALQPHKEYEDCLNEKYKEDLINYRLRKDIFKRNYEKILSKPKNNAEQVEVDAMLQSIGSEPKEPILPYIIIKEPTAAGLTKLLLRGEPSIGLFTAECGQFIGGYSMQKENQLQMASVLSELWDGEPLSRVRGGEDPERIKGRRLSIHLMGQPLVSAQVLANPVFINQGILSRMLTIYPESNIGKRSYKDITLRETREITTYRTRITEILHTPLPTREGSPLELLPRTITLSSDAKRTWVAFLEENERQMDQGGELEGIRSFANKGPEHALRLAAVLTLMEDSNAHNIPDEKIRAGIELVRYYQSESLRIQGVVAVNPQIELAEKLLSWCKTRGNYVSKNDIMQNGPKKLRSKRELEPILKILVDHYWLLPVRGGIKIEGVLRRNVWQVNQAKISSK